MMTYREGLHRCLHWSAIKQSTENYNSDLQEDLSCVSKLLDELEYQYVDVAGDKEEKKLLYAGLHALECKEKQVSYLCFYPNRKLSISVESL